MALELRVGNQTINNTIQFEYSINMNEVNRASIVINGNTDFQRTLLGIGNKISIYRDGTLEYVGVINNINNFEGNGLQITSRGEEEEYIKNPIDITSLGTKGVYILGASADIYSDLLDGGGVLYSGGTIATGVSLDFKVAKSDSYFNSVLNLHSKTGQEHEVNYTTKKINIVDSLGTANVDTLNLFTDFKSMQYSETEPGAKKIIVYGKGDGDYQITATATAAGYTAGIDNAIPIRDPTIISTAEAQSRADIELSKIKQNIKTYRIPIEKGSKPYSIGDTLIVNASTYDVENEEVRITRVIRGKQGDNEFLNIEVTNAEHSRTFKNASQEQAKLDYQNRAGDTFMQGSGNTLTFGPAALNCKNTAPLRVNFNLPKNFIVDETDAIRVNDFTVDYDVDPYRSGVGDAALSEDGDIDGITIDDAPPVVGETDSEELWSFIDSDSDTGTTIGSTFSQILSTAAFDTSAYSMFMVDLFVTCTSSHGPDETLAWEVELDGAQKIVDFRTDFGDTSFNNAFRLSYLIRSTLSGTGDVDINMKSSDLHLITSSVNVYGVERNHTHAAGTSLDTDDHGHDAGTPITGIYLDANSFNSDFTIGDDVSDAASVNATSVDIYLDFWNGSAWINKHSVLATGKTVDTEVDISNGGVYPDIWGLWSVRIVPNSASSDLVIGSVNVKHNLDNS